MFKYKQKTVEDVLRTDLRARRDDKWLILQVWESNGLILNEAQKGLFLSKALPSTETIRRSRQLLQEKGKYLPVKEVQEARKVMAENVRMNIVQEELIWE